MEKNYLKSLFLLALFGLSLSAQSQQYTESFNTAPTLTQYPGVPSWQQTATVTQGGVSYQFISGGNGGWEYKTTGGYNNTANLLYSTAATTTVRIKRADGSRFQFYGAWLQYTNYSNGYTAPWLRVTYEGYSLVEDTFNANTTVVLSKNVNVTSVVLNFSGLQNLNFDNIIVGPANPIAATVTTTTTVSSYDQTSATLGGGISDDGGAPVTDRGIVYATNDNPTVADNKVTIGSGTGSFSTVVSGLNASTTYYFKAFATTSVGTSYGSLGSFTTLAPFAIAGVHNFNTTSWATTGGQATPYTKANTEGWDITSAATGGTVGVNRITGANAGEGVASVRTISSTAAENLLYFGIKANNGSAFSLKSFIFRYGTKATSTSFGTITVTGYKNGVAVPGAVQSLTGVNPVSVSTAYNTFTIPDGNANFKNIDEFRLTASDPANSARLSYFDFDALTAESASSTLPLTLTSFKASQTVDNVQLSWSSAAEINVEKFMIERSSNGIDFLVVGEVKASGSLRTTNYNWTDYNPAGGNTFYRLRMVDKDKSSNYSTIAKVGGFSKHESWKIAPNPVLHKSMGIAFNNFKSGTYDVNVFDGHGSLMYTRKIELTGISSYQKIAVPATLNGGVYTVQIRSDKVVYSTSVILQ